MTDRIPIVQVAGQQQQLQAGDLIDAAYLNLVNHDDDTCISGFKHFSTATTLTIGGGKCWNQRTGQIVATTGTTVLTNSGLANSTQYYCYMDNAGTVTLSTVAPTIYSGTASSMTGNTGKRFLFPIHTGPTSAPFIVQKSDAGNNTCQILFLHNVGVSSRLVSGGTSTVAANASAVSYAPPNFTETLILKIQNTAAGTTSSVRPYVYTSTAFTIFSSVAFSSSETFEIPCDTTPKVQYDVTASGVANIDLMGYTFSR